MTSYSKTVWYHSNQIREQNETKYSKNENFVKEATLLAERYVKMAAQHTETSSIDTQCAPNFIKSKYVLNYEPTVSKIKLQDGLNYSKIMSQKR